MIGVAIMPLYIIISTWKSYYATSYFATNDTKTPPDTYLLVRGIIIDNVLVHYIKRTRVSENKTMSRTIL